MAAEPTFERRARLREAEVPYDQVNLVLFGRQSGSHCAKLKVRLEHQLATTFAVPFQSSLGHRI